MSHIFMLTSFQGCYLKTIYVEKAGLMYPESVCMMKLRQCCSERPTLVGTRLGGFSGLAEVDFGQEFLLEPIVP